MNEVVAMQPQHCAQAAVLHLAHLNTPFRGRPGQELLTIYYRAVCQGQGAYGFVAVSGSNVSGFICGVWDPSALRQQITRHSLPALGGWAALLVFRHPALLLDFFKRVAGPGLGRGGPSGLEFMSGGYELRPIVVSPEARGSGVADMLVKALLRDAAGRGYSQVHLYTETANLPARKFYDRLGFVLAGEAMRDGNLYQRYTISTRAAA